MEGLGEVSEGADQSAGQTLPRNGRGLNPATQATSAVVTLGPERGSAPGSNGISPLLATENSPKAKLGNVLQNDHERNKEEAVR